MKKVNKYDDIDSDDMDGLSSTSEDQNNKKKKVQFQGYQERDSNAKGSFVDGQYKARCDFSLMSNYILYLIFTTQTGAYIYYAFIYKAESKRCYASLPDLPQA